MVFLCKMYVTSTVYSPHPHLNPPHPLTHTPTPPTHLEQPSVGMKHVTRFAMHHPTWRTYHTTTKTLSYTLVAHAHTKNREIRAQLCNDSKGNATIFWSTCVCGCVLRVWVGGFEDGWGLYELWMMPVHGSVRRWVGVDGAVYD